MIDIPVALAIGGAVILLGLLGRRLFSSKTGNPALDQILTALTPYAMKAIVAGERSVIWGLDELGTRIEAEDKKAVADSIYAILPEYLVVPGFPVPVPIGVIKRLVPQEDFEALVKRVYDSTDAFIQANEQYLRSQILEDVPEAKT